MATVLITGGGGFLGSHCSAVMASEGWDVIIFDDLSGCSIEVVQELLRMHPESIRFVKGDILNTNLLQKTIAKYQVVAVIHFAALKVVNESFINPINYHQANFYGTLSVVRAMESAEVKTLVYSSSAAVYGDPVYLPIDEQHPTSPLSPYARTKLYSEQLLADLVESDINWRIIVLRYFNPVGAHDSGSLGEDFTFGHRNLIGEICNALVQSERKFFVFGIGNQTKDGSCVRDFVHVMDIAEGHLAALRYLMKPQLKKIKFIETFNLGTGEGVTVLEFVKACEKASGRSISIAVGAPRQGDISASYACVDKALRLLNWRASRTLQEMCKSSIDYYIRSRGDNSHD